MATIAWVEKMRKPMKYATKFKNRCRLCGRARSFIRDFGICRICFRKLAHQGELPGVTKSSW
jgi:small subunit ribosomal protein S14